MWRSTILLAEGLLTVNEVETFRNLEAGADDDAMTSCRRRWASRG